MVRELATHGDAAIDAAAVHGLDRELDLAVAEDQGVAGVYIGRQLVVGDADAARRALGRVDGRVERESRAFVEHHAAVREPLDADLRALQVAEYRNVLADPGSRAPNTLDPAPVRLGLSMREVDADDVGAAANDILEDGRVVSGGSERGDDLGATKH